MDLSKFTPEQQAALEKLFKSLEQPLPQQPQQPQQAPEQS